MTEASLRVEAISRSFGSFQAVRDLTFEARSFTQPGRPERLSGEEKLGVYPDARRTVP